MHPRAWIWIHAHSLPEPDPALHAARQGAWISLDGLSAATSEHILGMLLTLRDAGFLSQTLLSHDGDSYMNGESRPYHYLLTDFIPKLQANNFNDAEIQQMIVDNPANAYAAQVKYSPPGMDIK